MSYILGVRRFGVAAVVADSFLGRGPLTDRRHDFTSHKNGLLFPGCIYGISGAWDAACKFIARVQGHATGSTLAERWRSLERTVRIYDFPSVASAFQILFSSRHRIQPKFYVLNS